MKNFAIFTICLLMLFAAPESAQASSAFGSVNFGSGTTCTDYNVIGDIPGSAARITAGGRTIAIGYIQISAFSQHPIVISFDGSGNKQWCLQHEAAPPDGRARGIWWDGTDLYVVFTVDGGDGTFNASFATSGGWVSNLAGAGSGTFTIVSKLDPSSGAATNGTYVVSRLDNNNPNSFTPSGISVGGGAVTVTGTSAYLPVNPNGSQKPECGSPSDVTYTLSADLSSASSSVCVAAAPGAAGTGAPFAFTDGRINAFDYAPPVAIYCDETGVEVYTINPVDSQGTRAFSVSLTSVTQALGFDENTAIESAGGATLYALSSDELQVNAFDPQGKLYEFIFEPDRCEAGLTAGLPTRTIRTPAATTTPDAPATVPAITGGTVHVVQFGENLFRIGLRYGVPFEELGLLNGIAPPYRIFPGDRIVIPPR